MYVTFYLTCVNFLKFDMGDLRTLESISANFYWTLKSNRNTSNQIICTSNCGTFHYFVTNLVLVYQSECKCYFYVGPVNFILVPMFGFWKLILSAKSSHVTACSLPPFKLNFKFSCIFKIQTYNLERSFFGEELKSEFQLHIPKFHVLNLIENSVLVTIHLEHSGNFSVNKFLFISNLNLRMQCWRSLIEGLGLGSIWIKPWQHLDAPKMVENLIWCSPDKKY